MYQTSEPEMLTFKEAEEQYGVKRATLYRYVQHGRLLTYRRGLDKRNYIRRSDLEALRRFAPRRRDGTPSTEWIERARTFRQRTFGNRVLASSSTELIEQGRRDRTEQLP